MRRFIFLVLFFTLSDAINAQDCGDIKDGSTVRLDEEGKSLHKAKVQDQDGIGSCYANAASIMLQGSLDGHPEVSYINLALQNAERFNVAKKGSFAFMEKNDLLLTGGHVCDIVNSIRDSGGICQRKDVPLENIIFNSDVNNFQDSLFIQKEVMTKVSTYYDQVNLMFNQHKLNLKQDKLAASSGPKLKSSSASDGPETKTEASKEGFFTKIGKKFSNFFSGIFNRTKSETPPEPEIAIVEPVIKIIKKEEGPEFLPIEIRPLELLPTEKPIVLPEMLPLDDLVTGDSEDSEDGGVIDQSTFNRFKFNKLKNLKRPLTAKENYQLALYNLFQKKPKDFSQKHCERPDTTNANKFSQNLAAMIHNDFKKRIFNPIGLELRNIMYGGYTTTFAGKSEILEFYLNDNVKKMITDLYLPSLMSSPAPGSGKEAFMKALQTLLPKNTAFKNIEAFFNRLDPQILQLLEEDFNRYVKKDFSKCSQDKIAYLKSDVGFLKDFSEDPCLKNYIGLSKGINEMVIGLEKSNIKDFEKIADAILNAPDLNYENALTQALAPSCTEESKIKIPKNFNCVQKSIELPSESYDGGEKEKSAVADQTKKFRADLVSAIGEQNPMSISLCTIFFQEDSQYNYNKTKKCEVNRDHSFHAVNVIGYRCNKGKVDYLIQNSWGDWRNLNKDIQRDSKYGKAWFSEESMINNTYNYSVINKK